MLHRVASLLIIVFWLTMTALLVRNEFAPEGSRMREVPIGHVLKLLFIHEQTSRLNITSDAQPIGQFNLHPHIDPTTEMRVLNLDGMLHVRLGAGARQRVQWDGAVIYDRAFAFRHLDFGFTLFYPTQLKVQIEVQPEANRAHVALSGATGLIDERDYTLDQAGAHELLAQMGVDPALLASFGATAVAPTFRARQSSLLLHGERVDTYLVTIEQGGQVLADIHVSQLGNVLQMKTLLGYTLAPDDPVP